MDGAERHGSGGKAAGEREAGPLDPPAVAARVAGWLDRDPALPPPGPLTLEIYPTLRCNLDCAFCDTTDRHRPPVGEPSDARWLEVIDEAAALGVRRVLVLGGGEPLARRGLAGPLVRRVRAHGMEGILTTNGTLLTAEVARAMVEGGWDEVHVSIDSADPATHDRLRGRPGAFRAAVRAACRLRVFRERAGRDRPRLAIHAVVLRDNWRELPDLVRLAASLGAFRVDFDALVAYTPEQRALALTPGERAAVPAVARAALDLADRLGIATTLEHFLAPERLDRGHTDVAALGRGPGLLGAPCLRAWHHLVVAADGRVGPCCVLGGQGGRVQDRPLAELWRDDPFLASVRAAMRAGRPPERCAECSWNILGHEARIAEALRRRAGAA